MKTFEAKVVTSNFVSRATVFGSCSKDLRKGTPVRMLPSPSRSAVSGVLEA